MHRCVNSNGTCRQCCVDKRRSSTDDASGHPTISMASEVVKVVVRGHRVDTDCTFVFDNSGDACTVNMGFPDFGLWAYNYEHKKASTIFTSFKSYVDGKPVSTKLVLGQDHREQWQTKLVSFDKNGTRVVHEVYSTEVGVSGSAAVTLGAASISCIPALHGQVTSVMTVSCNSPRKPK